MNKKTFFFLIVIIIGLCGCKKERVNENTIETFSIDYELCSAWVDYSYKVTIENNGTMLTTESRKMTNLLRQSNYHLNEYEVTLIKKELAHLSPIKINLRYGFGNDKPTDLPVTLMRYKTNFKSDSTTIYYPDKSELPQELDTFLSILRQIILKNDTIKN